MNRERKALLKDRARHFASEVIGSIEAVASGQFDYLELTHEEMLLIGDEMQAISRRILPTPSAKDADHG